MRHPGVPVQPLTDAGRRSRDETSRDDACATARQRLFDEGLQNKRYTRELQ